MIPYPSVVIRCPKNFSDVLNQSHLSNLSLSPDFKIAFRTIVMCLRWADGDFEKMIISSMYQIQNVFGTSAKAFAKTLPRAAGALARPKQVLA